MVLTGERESVLVTTVDHGIVRELIHTHKVDIERNPLIDIVESISGDPSDALRARGPLFGVNSGSRRIVRGGPIGI